MFAIIMTLTPTVNMKQRLILYSIDNVTVESDTKRENLRVAL